MDSKKSKYFKILRFFKKAKPSLNSVKVLTLALLLASSISYATWQGTSWVMTGETISSVKLKANMDYLYSLFKRTGNDIYYTEGNVGIGTDSPQSVLSIGNKILLRKSGNVDSTESDILFNMQGGIAAQDSMYFFIDADNDSDDSVFSFRTNGETRDGITVSELVTIKENGNVGIGINNPLAKLHIFTAANDKIRLDGTQADPHTVVLGGNQGFRFWDDNNGELLRITETGNVGIGTRNPQNRLDVTGSVSINGNVFDYWFNNTSDTAAAIDTKYRITRNDGTGNFHIYINSDGGNSPTRQTSGYAYHEQYDPGTGLYKIQTAISGVSGSAVNWQNVLALTGAGNVGMGTTVPSEKLEVNGNVKATAFYYSSDQRLKKDIKTIQGLDLINKLRGVEFRWKDSNEKSAGLIAQEVEKVAPYLVKTDKNTGLKSVLYANLVAPLIEAVKELYSEISNIKKMIADIIFTQKKHDEELRTLKKELEIQRQEIKELKLKLQNDAK